MTKIKDRSVEPIDDPHFEAAEVFRQAGWTSADSSWLARLCANHLRGGVSPSAAPPTEADLKLIARSLPDSGALPNRERALLIAFARMVGCGGEGCRLSSRESHAESSTGSAPLIAAIAEAFRSQGAQFEEALKASGWPGTYDIRATLAATRNRHGQEAPVPAEDVPELHRLMRLLVEHAGLDLTKLVDASAIVGAGSRRCGPDAEIPWRVPDPIKWDEDPSTDPTSLAAWLIALGPTALRNVDRVMQQQPDDAMCAAFAAGIRDAIERWLRFAAGFQLRFQVGGDELAELASSYLDELERRMDRESTSARILRKQWIGFARCATEAAAARIPELRRDRLLRAAGEDLAALRPLFARARPRLPTAYAAGRGHGLLPAGSEREPWEEFEWEREHFENCTMLLFHLGGVWRGMKPLLLALRAMACPCVAPDLRYWNEPSESNTGHPRQRFVPAPEPWSLLPSAMINHFHAYVGREQASDPELVELRSNLAAFCLRGLADRWSEAQRNDAKTAARGRTNEDMIERSPEWRWCMIRAAAALHVNPEGKGHRLLEAASRHDPDREVREAAHEAYERLRRAKGLPADVSPRRAIMTALWWLRQAHLLGLGEPVDADGAQRTRVKELTRTKDQERSERTQSDTSN